MDQICILMNHNEDRLQVNTQFVFEIRESLCSNT